MLEPEIASRAKRDPPRSAEHASTRQLRSASVRGVVDDHDRDRHVLRRDARERFLEAQRDVVVPDRNHDGGAWRRPVCHGRAVSSSAMTNAHGPQKKVMRIIARLNIGGPAIQAITLSQELERFGYRTRLMRGVEDPAEGNMDYLAGERGVVPTLVPSMRRDPGLGDFIALSAVRVAPMARPAGDRAHACGQRRHPRPCRDGPGISSAPPSDRS